jgi:UDP-N-acetylmuramate--alanine ligase
MLVEACEYRANFLHLSPQQAVVLGIEPDHFDYYRSQAQLERAFAAFAARVPEGGLLLACDDCPVARRVTAGLRCRVETFGLHPGADWSAREVRGQHGRYWFSIARRGKHLGEVRLRIPGRHNVANALAAAAIALANGVPAEQVCRGLGDFRGLVRRLEPVGSWRGAAFVDDYAHHPTEVAAGLRAVREMYPGRRLWCVFQPHQASRTAVLLDELAASLQNADRVVVAEVFRAREGDYRPGEPTAADLGREVARRGVEVPQVHAAQEITRLLRTRLEPGDVVVTMGAGDIGKVRDGLGERIREDRAAG